MSFLAARLAGKESAFFAQESKIAASRLRDKLSKAHADASSPSTAEKLSISNSENNADVLPEILRHSIPLGSTEVVSSTSLVSRQSSLASLSSARGGSPSEHHRDLKVLQAMNPLNALVSIPRATFGPKRWTLPSEELSLQASTANEIRKDHTSSIDTEKMKAAMEGISTIGKAFAIATGMIFVGTILAGAIATQKLWLHTLDDVRREVKIFLQPKVEAVKERCRPLKTWVERTSNRWHLDQKKHEAIGAEFARGLHMKGTNEDVHSHI